MTGSIGLDEWALTITEAGQRESFFFRVGTETEMGTGTSSVEFVVCGLEVISAEAQAHLLFAERLGTNKYKKFSSSEFT